MILIESTVTKETVLDRIDERMREAQDGGLEPRFIVLGPTAYDHLRHAMSARYGRSPGYFEQYQYLTLVVDPGRDDRFLIVPAPRDVAEGVRIEQH